MIKRFLAVSLFAVGLSLVAAGSPRASPRQIAQIKRLSVLDYYYLLPYVGLTGNKSRRERESLLQTVGETAQTASIIDLRHDYLSVQPDSAPREQVAVFRFDGADLIAQSAPDYHSDYNSFSFYKMVDGKLRDVTQKVLPRSLSPLNYLIELPRVGTTIHVYVFDLDKQNRTPAFDLQWRRGRFVVAKLKR